MPRLHRGGGVTATLATLHRARGPGLKPRKTQLTARYLPEVVAYFKATGKGWQARLAFRDPFAVEWLDNRFDYEEERYNLLGMVEGRLLFVAYTPRGDVIHLISA